MGLGLTDAGTALDITSEVTQRLYSTLASGNICLAVLLIVFIIGGGCALYWDLYELENKDVLFPYPVAVLYLLATECHNILHWKVCETSVTVTLENKITHVVSKETWINFEKETRTDIPQNETILDLDSGTIYYPYISPKKEA